MWTVGHIIRLRIIIPKRSFSYFFFPWLIDIPELSISSFPCFFFRNIRHKNFRLTLLYFLMVSLRPYEFLLDLSFSFFSFLVFISLAIQLLLLFEVIRLTQNLGSGLFDVIYSNMQGHLFSHQELFFLVISRWFLNLLMRPIIQSLSNSLSRLLIRLTRRLFQWRLIIFIDFEIEKLLVQFWILIDLIVISHNINMYKQDQALYISDNSCNILVLVSALMVYACCSSERICSYLLTSFSESYRYINYSFMGSTSISALTRCSITVVSTSSFAKLDKTSYILYFFMLFMNLMAASMKEIASLRCFLKKFKKEKRYLASEIS